MIRVTVIVYMSFLIKRAKHELSYVDDGEAFEISCYDDIMERVRYSQIGCNYIKKVFANFSKTSEEVVVIFYNSIILIIKQFTILLIQNTIIFCDVKASRCLYYSTEHDSDYDDDVDDCYEFAEAVQNDRVEFFQVIMICVE